MRKKLPFLTIFALLLLAFVSSCAEPFAPGSGLLPDDDDWVSDDDDSAASDDDDTSASDDDDDDAGPPDADGDGIPDEVEGSGDSDGDGTPDYLDEDSDGDQVPDSAEGADDPDGDGIPSYLDEDSDGDGLLDTDEAGSDPLNPPDSDGDGFYDFEDADSDNDGIPDNEEAGHGTSRTKADSDDDGFTDLAELTWGSSPTDASSGIDGFYSELSARQPSSVDVPFTPELLVADVLFLLDTTCSMTDVLDDVRSNFSQIVANLAIPDVAYGVAEFDDYAMSPFGSTNWGDKPYILRQQVTDNTTAVQSTLNLLTVRDGLDWPESAMEAIYQACSGQGYDQNCDGNFQWDTDVRPFVASGADAFAGSESGIYDPSEPGNRGGAGFREGALPVIVYATDAELRDPAIGYAAPAACSDPASSNDAVSAASQLGARLIALKVQGNSPPGSDDPLPAMNNLANQTGSVADLDGDGVAEPLVYQGTSSATVSNIMAGIQALSATGSFDLSLAIDDQGQGFVQSIDPTEHLGVQLGTEVTFTVHLLPTVPITASDQVFVFPMVLTESGGAVLAEWELVLVVQP